MTYSNPLENYLLTFLCDNKLPFLKRFLYRLNNLLRSKDRLQNLLVETNSIIVIPDSV